MRFDNASNGSAYLHLNPNAVINPGKDNVYEVAFQVFNPPFDQESPATYIEGGGSDANIIFIKMPRTRLALGQSASKVGKTLGLSNFNRPMFVTWISKYQGSGTRCAE